MKQSNNKFSKRLLAIACIVAMLFGIFPEQLLVQAETTESEYTTYTLADFGYTEATTLHNDTATAIETKSIGNGNAYLDDCAIEGYFNFEKGDSTNYLFVGGDQQYKGLLIRNNSDGSISFFHYTLAGGSVNYGNLADTSGKLTPAIYNANNGEGTKLTYLTGQDLKIRLEYQIDDTTVDSTTVTIKVIINDVYENTITVNGTHPANSRKFITVLASAGSTFKFKPDEYETLTLEDFGIEEATPFYSATGSAYQQYQIDSTSLDGCAIEGYYNFYGEAGTNYVFFGRKVWEGFFIASKGSNSIEFVYNSDKGSIDYGALGGAVLTTDTYNSNNGDATDLTNITGQDLKIRLEYDLADPTAEKTTITIKVIINEAYENTFTITDAYSVHNVKSVVPYAKQGYQFKIKPYQYEAVTLTDFGYDEVTTVNNSIVLSEKTVGKTLNNYIVEGYYTFVDGDAGDCQSRIRFGRVASGANAGVGTCIEPWSSGTELMVRHDSGTGAVTAGKYAKILLDDYNKVANVKLDNFYAQEFKLSVKFSFEDPASSSTKLNLFITINDVFTQEINLTNVDAAAMTGTVGFVSSSNAAVIAKSVLPEVDLTTDIGIVEGTYDYNRAFTLNGQYTTGAPNYEACSLLSRTFAQDITFSKCPGTTLYYAGQSATSGIKFETQSDGTIAIAAANNEFAETYTLDATTAGVESLLGAELNWELRLYTIGEDVGLGVYINNKLYNDDLFTLTEAAANLGSYVGVSVPDKGNIKLGDSSNVDFYQETVYHDLTNGSYNVTGTGKVKVDYVENRTSLSSPGEYFVYADGGETEKDAYAKWVVLYKPGDANLDGINDVRDLVAMKKRQAIKQIADFDSSLTEYETYDTECGLYQIDDSLNNYVIEGCYRFSDGAGSNRVVFGSKEAITQMTGTGFHISPWNSGANLMVYYGTGGSPTNANLVKQYTKILGTDYNAGNGDAADLTSFCGTDLKLRVAFSFEDASSTSTTMTVKITINDVYTHTETCTEVDATQMVGSVAIWSSVSNAPISVTSDVLSLSGVKSVEVGLDGIRNILLQ